ncbi:MAG: GNAT family N-acetyltransferase [Clostridia bacterium]
MWHKGFGGHKNQILLGISGFAIIRLGVDNKGDKRYYIEKLFVDPKYQNEGIGQSLLKAILNNFNDCSISVSTFKDNRIAAHIFLKLGFKHTTNRKMNIEYGKNILTFPQSYYLLERK